MTNPSKTKLIDEATLANVNAWLNSAIPEEEKEAIREQMAKHPQEIIDAFYQRLSFGTGGLRGIMGMGSNRINVYTIRMATQGLATYLKKSAENPSVVIGYDSRLGSRVFAEETAGVFAANGIRAYLYASIHPVPLVSFGVRHLGASAGVMITASHNPPAYNGYKVYWSDGAQVLPPHDKGIIQEVNEVENFADIPSKPLDDPLIESIGEVVDAAYLKTLHALQNDPGDNLTNGNKLRLLYSSLHGAGYDLVPKTLKSWGFTNLSLIEEQKDPDGHFPTITSPNPEYPEVLALGIEQMKEQKGDLFLATDADVDRLGVVVWHKEEPVILTGNEIASLATWHLLSSLTHHQEMPPKPMIVKTIVTTELIRAIATHYNATCIDVLTGFKYIGQKITEWEKEGNDHTPSHHFIFGGEESFGYLMGTYARDKDAIVSAALMAEIALHLKMQGKTLIDALFDLYKTHGVYREKLLSLTFEGKKGATHIRSVMKGLRDNLPHQINGITVEQVEDYEKRIRTSMMSHKSEPITLPQSNILRFWLEDGTTLVIRPSGTEPKIKLYVATHTKSHPQNEAEVETMIQESDKRADDLLRVLEASMQP